MQKLKLGYAFCGSFCTFKRSIEVLKSVCDEFETVVPVMSAAAYNTDTRFGKAEDFRREIEEITKNKIISAISEAEPIGPKNLLDALIIAPATGNTIAKLANGITDTSVTMAAKATLRNEKPVIICVSTNDALSNSAKNIGALLNMRGVYFVPLRQDDCKKKPRSVVADFDLIIPTVNHALKGEQIQPIF
ncbi:MAG: dipicolinate synthase subunit B [Acutalibacteraceae bacterium]